MMMVVTTILAIVFVSYLQSKKVRNTAQWVSRTSELLYNSETILATVMNNVTDARGYALTGSDKFLGSLQKSAIDLTTKLAALKELIADNAVQQKKIDSIAIYISKRVEFSNRVVAARKEKGLAGASDLSTTGEGTLYVEQIRQLMYELQATENMLLLQRKSKNERAFKQLNTVLLVLGLLVLILVFITFLAGRELLYVEKQLADQKVKSNQELLEVAEEQAGLGSWDYEVATQKGKWSKEMFRLFGFQIKEEVPDFDEYLERIHPEDRPQVLQALSNMQEGKEPVSKNYRTNPEIIPLRYLKPTSRLEKDKYGNAIKFSGTLLDITDRVEAEQKIIKASRLYFFISQINQMIVRVNEEKILFEEACRIAVDIGKFRMAWIGIIDEETKQVVPVMYAGEERNYLTKIKSISVADVPEGKGPTGTALREGKYIVCNDIESDPQMGPWKEAALARGYLSSMALPIKKLGKVIGAFSFYASEKNYFDKQEIVLLEEATGDVSFALEVFEKERLRKQAEAAVVHIYKEKEMVLNRVSDAMISLDNEWRYTFLNDAALATHPLGREETLGRSIWDVHPELEGTVFWEVYHKAMATRKVVEVESFYEPMNSWFSGKVYPSADGLTIFYSDITERKLAEEGLAEKENQLRLFVEYSPAALAMLDMDMKYIVASKNWMQDYNLGNTDIIGKSHYEIFPEITEQWKEIHQRCLKGAIEKKEEDMFIRADGSVDWVRWEIHPWVKAAGEIGGIIMLTEVITERIKAKEEIVKEKNLSDSIINSLPGIFYLYTKDGKFLRWNKNFEQVSKYSGEEIGEMHPLDFFDENDKELLTQKIANTFIVGEENVQSDFLLKTKEKIPYYFTGKAIEYEDSICLMGVGIDFTERVRAQEIIKDTTLKLRQLTAHLQNIREEERKRIGREIHDELGQQLTAIKMDISWIDKKIIDETGIIKNKLKNIIGLLDGSNQSIRRILSELRPGLLDERGLIEAVKWLGRQFTENTGLPVHFSSTETEIKLAEPQATCIFRVYQEALTNIMRYAKANNVLASLNIVNGDVVVTISDDGQGFSPQALQRKPTFGILGMKERVASLNGNFELESAPGRGTKITFSIPYHEGSLT